jgi:hypothetical protein
VKKGYLKLGVSQILPFPTVATVFSMKFKSNIETIFHYKGMKLTELYDSIFCWIAQANIIRK